MSTRRWQHGFAALQAYRPRWHIEDDTYRELKEGWGLEKQHWGRDLAAARGRVTLTCLAFNTAQVYRLRAGSNWLRWPFGGCVVAESGNWAMLQR